MVEGIDEILQYFDDTLNVLDAAIVIAGEGLAGDMANRVHKDGQATDGGPIGPNPNTGEVYSTKPFWADPRDFAKKGFPQGLLSSTGGSVQLPEGYKDFRAFSGRQVSKVDLRYSGNLQTSYRFTRLGNMSYGVDLLGKGTPPSRGISAAQKAAHLESLYDKEIFSPMAAEYDSFIDDIEFEWANRST